MLKILILHGWAQSVDRFLNMKIALESKGHLVTLYEFKGFGNVVNENDKIYSVNSILSHYKHKLISYLSETNYDVIIGHDMGATIALQVAVDYKLTDIRFILLNPIYEGMNGFRFITRFPSLLEKLIDFIQGDNKIFDFIRERMISYMIVRYIENDDKIDDQLFEDISNLDSYIASRVLSELVYNKWRVKENISLNMVILYSENDILVSEDKLSSLCSLCNTCLYKMNNIGHASIIDDEELVIDYVYESIIKR